MGNHQARRRDQRLVDQPEVPVQHVAMAPTTRLTHYMPPIMLPMQLAQTMPAGYPMQLTHPMQIAHTSQHTQPMKSPQPMQPAQAIHPAQRVQLAHPTLPSLPAQLSNSMEQTHPLQPAQPFQSAYSLQPAQPFQSAYPMQTPRPVHPEHTIQPKQSMTSVHTVRFVDPLQSTQREQPVDPVAAAEPTQPVHIVQSPVSVPMQPVAPVQLMAPEAPAAPLETKQLLPAEVMLFADVVRETMEVLARNLNRVENSVAESERRQHNAINAAVGALLQQLDQRELQHLEECAAQNSEIQREGHLAHNSRQTQKPQEDEVCGRNDYSLNDLTNRRMAFESGSARVSRQRNRFRCALRSSPVIGYAATYATRRPGVHRRPRPAGSTPTGAAELDVSSCTSETAPPPKSSEPLAAEQSRQ